jgi:hypothetical protein
MSACLVSEDHINAIVTYGIDTGFIFADNAPKVTEALTAHNMLALAERYPNVAESAWMAAPYTFKRVAPSVGDMRRTKRNIATAIIKLCDCFDYQASESSSWEGSAAHRLLNIIRLAAESNGGQEHGPIYNHMPWDL